MPNNKKEIVGHMHDLWFIFNIELLFDRKILTPTTLKPGIELLQCIVQ
jgi:hypothetical protein